MVKSSELFVVTCVCVRVCLSTCTLSLWDLSQVMEVFDLPEYSIALMVGLGGMMEKKKDEYFDVSVTEQEICISRARTLSHTQRWKRKLWDSYSNYLSLSRDSELWDGEGWDAARCWEATTRGCCQQAVVVCRITPPPTPPQIKCSCSKSRSCYSNRSPSPKQNPCCRWVWLH